MTDKNLKHRRFIKALRRGARGQALIELAITMPLLILLLGGAVELGMATYAAIEVSNAAKAAVQYAASGGGANVTFSSSAQPTLDSTGMLTAANADAFNLPTTSPITFSTGYPTAQCSCSNGVGTSTCYSGDCPGAQIEETITVKTQVTFTPGLHVAGMSSFTLHGYAQQKVLQ